MKLMKGNAHRMTKLRNNVKSIIKHTQLYELGGQLLKNYYKELIP